MYILLGVTLFALLLVEILVISILEDGNILLLSLKSILDISLNGSPVTDIVSVTLELQNEVSWTGYTTVNKAVSATTMYPSGFTVSKKILAGSITQYLTNGNSSTVQTFDTDASLSIKAGNGLSGSFFRGFSFGPAVCSFTNRVNSQSAVYVQSYDWRLVENPASLATILKYETD